MTEQQENILKAYERAVIAAPPALHLTSANDRDIFWDRHIADGLKLVESIPPYIRKGADVIDIGSGNGIPGLIIAVMRPDFDVVLLDSDNKKCGFLDMFCNLHVIKNTRVICDRAENISKMESNRFDLVTARAIGPTPVALELSAGLIKRGGTLIVPHGTNWKEAANLSKRASEFLGFTLAEHIPYKILGQEFYLTIYRKTSDTPLGYPRSVGVPAKRPLK